MKTLQYTTIDKSTWGAGPWQTEPDKKQWQDPATGLPCLIVRGSMGVLCDYVGVDETHPLFGQGFAETSDLECHGGITFTNSCHPVETPATGICHVPGEGKPDHVWWFGFDCGHSNDAVPGLAAMMMLSPSSIGYVKRFYNEDVYRDFGYVIGQVQHLAAQLRDAACPIEYRPKK